MDETTTRLTDAQRNLLRDVMTKRAGVLRREIGGALRRANGAGVERDERELAEVERALAQLAVDDYGRCIECGAPIGWERLAVQPQARRCIPCEAVREARGPRRPTL